MKTPEERAAELTDEPHLQEAVAKCVRDAVNEALMRTMEPQDMEALVKRVETATLMAVHGNRPSATVCASLLHDALKAGMWLYGSDNPHVRAYVPARILFGQLCDYFDTPNPFRLKIHNDIDSVQSGAWRKKP